jgi:hypothetical protein
MCLFPAVGALGASRVIAAVALVFDAYPVFGEELIEGHDTASARMAASFWSLAAYA